MDKNSFINQFKSDLKILGVRSGGVLMVHPALRSFGYVPGGAKTVIDGLIQTVGESGTLLMPALSWENVTPENPVFNLTDTPSCVGMIAETFRCLPQTIRSMHPTHSVSAFGPLAVELTTTHQLDNTPCGPNSPFRKLPKYNAQILMLACGLAYNTSLHAIEELVNPPYLFEIPINYSLTDIDNITYEKEYIPHNFIGWQQRYDRVARVLKEPDLLTSQVVGTNSHLLEASSLWDISLNFIKQDPLYFVEQV
jgi:aminoglycoside 3-N-acetyltransferase